MKCKRTARRESGLTIVETMIALAIAGLMLAVGMTAFRSYQSKESLKSGGLLLTQIINDMLHDVRVGVWPEPVIPAGEETYICENAPPSDNVSLRWPTASDKKPYDKLQCAFSGKALRLGALDKNGNRTTVIEPTNTIAVYTLISPNPGPGSSEGIESWQVFESLLLPPTDEKALQETPYNVSISKMFYKDGSDEILLDGFAIGVAEFGEILSGEEFLGSSLSLGLWAIRPATDLTNPSRQRPTNTEFVQKTDQHTQTDEYFFRLRDRPIFICLEGPKLIRLEAASLKAVFEQDIEEAAAIC